MVLEKTLESPLDCKEIQPVHSNGDQSWVFFGRKLKLKLQYFGHLIRRVDSLEKTLMLGQIGSAQINSVHSCLHRRKSVLSEFQWEKILLFSR